MTRRSVLAVTLDKLTEVEDERDALRAEVERLQADNEVLRERLIAVPCVVDEHERLVTEVARLQAKLDAALVWREKRADEISLDLGAVLAEVERLQAIVTEVGNLHRQTGVGDDCAEDGFAWPCPTRRLMDFAVSPSGPIRREVAAAALRAARDREATLRCDFICATCHPYSDTEPSVSGSPTTREDHDD